MNKLILILFIALNTSLTAQKLVDMNPEIDKEQRRLDSFDGRLDRQINIALNDEQKPLYTQVYFVMTDSLQNRINKSAKLNTLQKKNLLNGIYLTLSEINGKTFAVPAYYQKLFENAFGIVRAVEKNDLNSYLITDPLYAIKNLFFYKYEDAAKSFLLQSTNNYPDEVLKIYHKYKERPYADTIVEVCAIVAPNVAKNYLIGETGIKEILKNNTNPSIMGMRGFFKEYNILSKGMVIVDDIVEGNITLEEAHTISQDKRQFLRKMIEIRNSDFAVAKYSLDEELHSTSLMFVREINDLHNEADPKKRFKCIDDFNWKELYTLLVYSEEEIFTSTFNGVFERLMYRVNQEKMTGDKILETMKYNRFRTFIKICANYGKLSEFLATMPKDKSREVLAKFTNNLDQNEGDLRSSINVANAFSSITDSTLLSFMRVNIHNEFLRVETENSKNGLAIYGLLKSLFVASNKKDSQWYQSMASTYNLQAIDKIEKEKLFGGDKVHRQVHFFYDDEDGDASFSSFIATFTNPNYKITKQKDYVIIESIKGEKIKIFANHPKSELEGQGQLIKIMETIHKDIQMMVHRGHSYYAMNTIDQIPLNTKIVFLGSCGSYHNLHEVLNRSSNAHILSSKQIGVMVVNNPLIFNIAEIIREGKVLSWKDVWKRTEAQIKTNKAAMEKFKDYVSPDRNLGAIFLQAFTRLVTN